MIRKIPICLFIMLVSLMSSAQIADKVIKNAKIYTADASNTFAEAVAIKDGKFIYIGTDSGANIYINNSTEVLNANGKVILPGMHDVHIHALESSSENGASVILTSSITDAEQHIPELQNAAPVVNSNGWIMGWGHSLNTLLNATRKPRLILDEVFPTQPILIMEETSHSFWINTAGLNLLGINASTPDPVGGHIVKGRWGDGSPDGILIDNAGDAAREVALAQNATLQNIDYEGLRYYGLQLLAKNGITSLVDGRTYWKQNFEQVWRQIKNEGLLTVRVGLCPWVYPNNDDATQIPILQSMYDEGDDMLKVRQIKLYSDGITHNSTAALHEPYNVDLGFGFTDNKGVNYIDQTRMTNLITTLEQTGYDFFIHAIGDRGITESLNAIEAARNVNGDLGARHRLTHLEIVKPTDFPRFTALNITADMQVAGDFTQPNHWHENDYLLGAERSNNLVPVKSFYDAGTRVTLSSDWNVSAISPFVGIQNSLTRSPQNLPDVFAAVKAYTINGAYTMRQETVTGSVELGKYADLIMIDRDIFTIPNTQIGATKVIYTWLAGQEVYRDNLLSSNSHIQLPLDFDVYPTVTPKDLQIYYAGNEKQDSIVQFYDTKGKKIKEVKIQSNMFVNNELELDVSSFSEGIYLLQMQTGKGRKRTKKFIVSK
ncbi:amidohydrolase family protein [Pseudofulvibacter geojedonensis]|uniref:Amidohydrolase family protein n=1 Tax=Pseudofulvibacter geojedonensis TaxID=1123758 RepID=A0ABW3I5X3_9FLAO